MNNLDGQLAGKRTKFLSINLGNSLICSLCITTGSVNTSTIPLNLIRVLLILHPRNIARSIIAILNKLRIPASPPQQTELHKNRAEGEGRGKRESNRILRGIRDPESAERNGSMTDVDNHDSEGHDDSSSLGFLSKQLREPCHKRRASSVGCISHEIEAHDDFVI